MGLASLGPHPGAALEEHPCKARVAPREKFQVASLGTEGVQEGPRCLGTHMMWSVYWLVTLEPGWLACSPGVWPCDVSAFLADLGSELCWRGHTMWLGPMSVAASVHPWRQQNQSASPVDTSECPPLGADCF